MMTWNLRLFDLHY